MVLILARKVESKLRVATIAAVSVNSKPCSVLLLASSETRLFTVNEFVISWEELKLEKEICDKRHKPLCKA